MRVLALLTTLLCALGGAACSNLLGIEDPTPDFGGDGGPRTLVSIAIGPSPLDLPIGFSQQLTATGTFDDGSQDDITSSTEFSAEPGAAITVTREGLATGVSEGSATVTGKVGTITGSLTAQIIGALPTKLMFVLAEVRTLRQQSVRVRVMAELSDGRMQDATLNATYSSDNLAVATVTVPGRIDAGSDGTATITARLGSATPATISTVVLPRNCHVVINEVQTHGTSGSDEWVELLNPCRDPITINGWTLVYRAATNANPAVADTNQMMALSGTLMPGELRLYAGEDYAGTGTTAADSKWTAVGGFMQQTNGAIAVRDGTGIGAAIVDAMAYGVVTGGHPFIEGTADDPATANRSAARLPWDGHDEDSNASDFVQVMAPTPRQPNAP